jgi:hypothetical protein
MKSRSTVIRLGMFFFIVYLFMSTSALATGQPAAYTLTPFAELSKDIGTDASLLNQFFCDGKKENQLFTIAPDENVEGNSLRVRDSDTADPVFYRDGNLFAMDGSNADLSDFAESVLENLIAVEALPAGQQLIARLKRARYPIYIMSGTNRFEPREDAGREYYGMWEAQTMLYFFTLRKADDILPFHEIGVGGVVHWDPNLDVSTIESDGQSRLAPLPVTLAHEMYHAYDSARGLLDQREVDGPGYESEPVLEYRAVFFENQVRQQSGVRYRKNYSADETGSMLDANGNPIFIPSVCLKSIPVSFL